MRLSAAARVSGAVWFVPAVFGIQTLVLLGEVVPTGYTQSDYARAVAYSVYPAGPLLAGVAAFKLHGFRAFHSVAPQVRFGVVLRAYAPLVCGTALAVVLAMGLRILSLPSDGRTLFIVGFTALTVLACGLWGLAMAWVLPTVLAVPVAVAGPFFWIAYMPSLGANVAKQLTPDIPCCRVDMQVSSSYLTGFGSLVGVLVLGLACCLLLRRWSLISRGLAFCMVTGAAMTAGLVGVSLVGARTPVPVSVDEPRTADLVCVDERSQHICVWPEQQEMARAVAPLIQDLNGSLDRWGMPVVDGVHQVDPDDGELAIATPLVDIRDRNDLALFVAAGYVAREAGCERLHGDEAADERVAALALTIGWRPDETSIPPGRVAAARAALSATGNVADWFYSEIADVGCSRLG